MDRNTRAREKEKKKDRVWDKGGSSRCSIESERDLDNLENKEEIGSNETYYERNMIECKRKSEKYRIKRVRKG